MIDEIDLHLHPKLQREILRRLSEIFPNVQFIVTTHSPNVVIGALDIVQIIKLNQGYIDKSINIEKYKNYDVSLLLLSDIFDQVDIRTHEYIKLNTQYEKLLEILHPNKEEQNKIDELGKKLQKFSCGDFQRLRELLSK